jgi:hypothetical protein
VGARGGQHDDRGLGTASEILGRDLRREIRAGRVFADRARLPVHDADWDPLLASRRLAEKPRSHKRERGAALATAGAEDGAQ